MLLIAAAGTLTLVLAVMLFVVFGGRKDAEETDQAGVPPAEATQSSPPPIDKTPPAAANAPSEAAPETRTAVTPPEPPETAPVPVLASLKVTTNPTGASIRIDGTLRSERSNATLTGLPPGSHSVQVEKQGFVAVTRNVKLEAGREGQVYVTLKPPASAVAPVTQAAPTPKGEGTLLVRVDPFGDVYVDKELKSQGRVSSSIPVPSGRHEVRVVHPSFEPKVWTGVMIEAGKTTSLAWNFEINSLGGVRIVFPGGIWAEVFVDGVKYAKTAPCVVERLKPGKHTIELKRQGFTIEGSPQDVVVTAGATAEAKFRLKETP